MGSRMFFYKPLKVCDEFVELLNDSLSKIGAKPLTRLQKIWLSICITGVIVTNTICWKRFERASFGRCCSGTLSKMFRRGKIPWDHLLKASVLTIFENYDITSGVLALDGTDNPRSKNTTTIAKAHKIKDKASGGFINGQELTVLVLIADKITIPVGFGFYEPDPVHREWKKLDQELRKQGVAKKDRPSKPAKNDNYPTTIELGLELLKDFQSHYPDIKVKAILADALYGAKTFVQPASQLYDGVQVISQARKNQKIKSGNKYITIEQYFIRNPGVIRPLIIRGSKEQTVTMHGARLYLKSHGCKRFIVALKYEGEKEYRYLLASDLTWRLTDIATAYTLRWLVEVFIQDWKSYEGWCQLAKQPDIEGSCRGVILSLFVDHCLLLHPDQLALINNNLPAATVGSLRDRERANAVVEAIESLVNPNHITSGIVDELKQCIDNVIPLRSSSKHMNARDLGRLESTPGLKYKAAA